MRTETAPPATGSPLLELVRGAISDSLHRAATLDAEAIHVTSDGTDVWLSGAVRSWAARQQAENAARATPGVRSVRNDIHVRCPTAGELP